MRRKRRSFDFALRASLRMTSVVGEKSRSFDCAPLRYASLRMTSVVGGVKAGSFGFAQDRLFDFGYECLKKPTPDNLRAQENEYGEQFWHRYFDSGGRSGEGGIFLRR